MTLSAGSTLGPYEILERLGAGGMGVVYKARDTRLGRLVAVKVLPDELATDPELRERFEREARAVSGLNHPHICTVHDVGRHGATDFLVMELVEGPTLAALLARGPLPLDRALEYGVQIADALAKAHRHGIVHRDLKPGNVMIAPSGVKLVDFGLAKPLLFEEEPRATEGDSRAPTRGLPLTRNGTILGTFEYMAPEQLEGGAVDARTDLFSFGALLYETLTGRRAFEGRSRASLIASILERPAPDVSATQPLATPGLDRAVRRCLAKSPRDRWQCAEDLRDELGWIRAGGGAAETALPSAARPARRALPLGLAAAAGALLAAGLLLALGPRPAADERPVRRFTVELPSVEPLAGGGPFGPVVSLSPDGKNLVLVGSRDGRSLLYLRPLDRIGAAVIAGTDGARRPFFSPDGRSVAFFADGKLKKVALAGGAPLVLCSAPGTPMGGSWGDDGTIVFSQLGPWGLYRVAETGGVRTALTRVDEAAGGLGHYLPELLPRRRGVLFSRFASTGLTVAAVGPSGEIRDVLEGGQGARFVRSGHVVYYRAGALEAVPFDADRLEATGPAVTVVDDVHMQAQFDVADDGTLVYLPSASFETRGVLVRVRRDGTKEPLGLPPASYVPHPRVSPDGRRIAVTKSEATRSDSDIWIVDVDRGLSTRLTATEGEPSSVRPVWSPDGETVYFTSNRASGNYDIFAQAADGSAAARRVAAGAYRVPTSISADGRALFYRELSETTGWDIGVVEPEGTAAPRILFGSEFDEHTAMLSPDGRWLAYVSNESGRDEVYLRPYPALDRKWPVSAEGGDEPVWSRDGTELYYRHGRTMMAVAVRGGSELTLGKPAPLFEGSYASSFYSGAPSSNYDVDAEGRFLMIEPLAPSAPVRVHVVLNWLAELERLVPRR